MQQNLVQYERVEHGNNATLNSATSNSVTLNSTTSHKATSKNSVTSTPNIARLNSVT